MDSVKFQAASIVLAVAVTMPSVATQQESSPQSGSSPSRYELGRRTRAMERAWLGCGDKERRKAAVPTVQRAVNGYFAGDSRQVARSLDEAAAQLRGEMRSAEQVWADAVQVSIAPRLFHCDAASAPPRESGGRNTLQLKPAAFVPRELRLTAGWAYEPAGVRPQLRLRLVTQMGTKPILDQPLEDKLDVAIPPPANSERDTSWTVAICDERGATVRSWNLGISCVGDLPARLAKLRDACASLPDGAPAIEVVSARRILDLLTRLAEGETPETDLSAARLLRDAEQFARAASKRESALAGSSGEYLLDVPRGKSGVPVRVLVPKAAPTVAVFALHGAGGSENIFFDAYGDGMIVRLCRERGWMLVAPKVATPLDDLWTVVESIESAFNVKIQRRLIVGHSLGAVTALAMGQKQPDRVAAIAAISGGSFGDLQPLRSTPVFVAAGTQDFGKPGSASVAKRLEELGATVQFRLYECEHLLVVADSLPDIFQWFDGIAIREAERGDK